MNPVVLVGLFIGACLPFVFAALTMNSVGRAAQSVVLEVRRQFREITGLMEGKADPDYARCVDLCTKASLKEMVLPTVIAVVTPIVVGMILGFKGVVGLLAGATVTGFLMAIYMANAGGAWDNAKKYIEAGNFGGKGSDCHKAGVVGDTVGDPFKDKCQRIYGGVQQTVGGQRHGVGCRATRFFTHRWRAFSPITRRRKSSAGGRPASSWP